MVKKNKARAAPRKTSPVLARTLDEVVEVERKIVSGVREDVAQARHALDRMPFWGGISLMLLSAVLFLHGVESTTFMTTALGGTLAILIE